MLRDLDVGAPPICGNDNRLKGMVTDRDIVVKCLADGGDPGQTRAGELSTGAPVTIGADDDIELALRTMADHKVRLIGRHAGGASVLGGGMKIVPASQLDENPDRLSAEPLSKDGPGAKGQRLWSKTWNGLR